NFRSFFYYKRGWNRDWSRSFNGHRHCEKSWRFCERLQRARRDHIQSFPAGERSGAVRTKTEQVLGFQWSRRDRPYCRRRSECEDRGGGALGWGRLQGGGGGGWNGSGGSLHASSRCDQSVADRRDDALYGWPNPDSNPATAKPQPQI